MVNRLSVIYSVLKLWLWLTLDVIPPFRNLHGQINAKEIDEDRHYFIVVGFDRISVDRTTYHALDMGENIQVLYTRALRGIRIDRLLPDKDTD